MNIEFPFTGTIWALEKPSPPAFSSNFSDGGIKAKITLPNFPGSAKYVVASFSSLFQQMHEV